MKVSDLIFKLKLLQDIYGDLDIIYASDDEGNSYHPVNYNPTVGYFEESDFMPEHNFDSLLYYPNAICIN